MLPFIDLGILKIIKMFIQNDDSNNLALSSEIPIEYLMTE